MDYEDYEGYDEIDYACSFCEFDWALGSPDADRDTVRYKRYVDRAYPDDFVGHLDNPVPVVADEALSRVEIARRRKERRSTVSRVPAVFDFPARQVVVGVFYFEKNHSR